MFLNVNRAIAYFNIDVIDVICNFSTIPDSTII